MHPFDMTYDFHQFHFIFPYFSINRQYIASDECTALTAAQQIEHEIAVNNTLFYFAFVIEKAH